MMTLRMTLAALTIAAVSGCSSKSSSTGQERVTPWLEDGVIHYPQSFADREKIASAAAAEGLVTPSIQVTGTVTTDARLVAAIGARIAGRVRGVSKVEGDKVTAGEVVADVESAELGRAQADVLKIRAREQVARLDADRERTLADAKISPERDAQHARANAQALTAERIAAERGVQALGGTVGGEIGILHLKSPLSGRVVETHVRTGQTVQPSDTLFVVADLSRVWIELSVFERDLGAMRVGDDVEVHVPSAPNNVYHGRVDYVGETIDEKTRSAHVRVVLTNPGPLRPGLSVTATIHASGPARKMLKIPKEAVTRIDGQATVFVVKGEGKVDPRRVTLGPDDNQWVAVTDGLTEGEKVVTHGVLALKAEVYR